MNASNIRPNVGDFIIARSLACSSMAILFMLNVSIVPISLNLSIHVNVLTSSSFRSLHYSSSSYLHLPIASERAHSAGCAQMDTAFGTRENIRIQERPGIVASFAIPGVRPVNIRRTVNLGLELLTSWSSATVLRTNRRGFSKTSFDTANSSTMRA